MMLLFSDMVYMLVRYVSPSGPIGLFLSQAALSPLNYLLPNMCMLHFYFSFIIFVYFCFYHVSVTLAQCGRALAFRADGPVF